MVYEFKEHESQKVFDTEIIFNVEHGFAEFSVSVNWPEGIKGYVECSIEPDGQVTRKAGAWGSGQQVSILEFKWPHHH